MLKVKVGHSIANNSFDIGVEAIENSTIGLNNPKLGFLYTSVNSNVKEVLKGVLSKNENKFPIIGCTSSGMIMTPEGIIKSDNGFAGMMALDDANMIVGSACHEAGEDARAIGRQVAKEAVADANTDKKPAFFYMVASPKEEEEYLMGIQDVIGRVPMFGGSAADDTLEGKWSIYLNDKVFSDGVALAIIYSDNEIATSYTGAYNETKNVGIVTEVKNNRTIVSIDNEPALDKYAKWIGASEEQITDGNLLVTSITRPLGVKDQLGNLTTIRHPMFGDIKNRTINVGNKVVVNTAIMQMETTVDGLIDSVANNLKNVRSKINTNPAGYLLIHCGGRKIGIGERIDEVHKALVKEANGVPFITIFTFGEYGYNDNSANMCGGLMLSFTKKKEK